MPIKPEEYLTGIKLIDKQHKNIIHISNKLIISYKRGDINKLKLTKYIKEIVMYAVEHFDAEEFIMKSSGFSGFEKHRAAHNHFRMQLDNFLAGVEPGLADVRDYTAQLCKWLSSWLNSHLSGEDIELANFIKDKNIEEINTL